MKNKERKTVYKLFWVWDFEKEEMWLNEMANSGWVLDKVGFCKYTFVKCQPEEYSIRMEMHSYDPAYVDFLAETNVEYVGRMVQWLYFRKKTEHGAFDLFSDIDSRISHLDRIGKMIFAIGMANLGIGLANSFNHIINIGWVNLLCATLLMYALGRIHGKKEYLEKERTYRE